KCGHSLTSTNQMPSKDSSTVSVTCWPSTASGAPRSVPAPATRSGRRRGSCCPSRTQMPPEGVEARVPVTGQRGEKLLRDLDGGRLEPVADATPLARLGDDEPGLGEQAEVFGDRLPGD